MATVLKHWREAATLILVTGRSIKSRVSYPPVHNNGLSPASNVNSLKGDNFEILLLKRSSKSKFMPSLYVFPGGVADNSDFSSKWNDLFFESNNELVKNTYKYMQRGGKGAPMFSRPRDREYTSIPSELAFRICAIRETFEESGVLLARSLNDLKVVNPRFMENGPVDATSYIETSEGELELWRQKVYADASEFLTMCQELKILPDVWSLYEWSNWLTPKGQHKSGKYSRRYDTAFFVACVQDKPHAIQDHGETVHLQWSSPYSVLGEYFDETTKIAPPQLYELSRFMNFKDLSELHKFIWKREAQRVQRFLPIRINCQDAFLFLMPGDDLYPKEEDQDKESVLTETLDELNEKFPNQHRTFLTANSDIISVACTIPMIDGHVQPVTDLPRKHVENSSKL